MSAPFITLLAMVGLAIAYVLVPIVADTFSRYRRRRALRCPETGLVAEVQIDARHAARCRYRRGSGAPRPHAARGGRAGGGGRGLLPSIRFDIPRCLGYHWAA